jgi:hypothetical protein
MAVSPMPGSKTWLVVRKVQPVSLLVVKPASMMFPLLMTPKVGLRAFHPAAQLVRDAVLHISYALVQEGREAALRVPGLFPRGPDPTTDRDILRALWINAYPFPALQAEGAVVLEAAVDQLGVVRRNDTERQECVEEPHVVML